MNVVEAVNAIVMGGSPALCASALLERKAAAVGSIHHRKDGNYKKVSTSKWQRVESADNLAALVVPHVVHVMRGTDENGNETLSDTDRRKLQQVAFRFRGWLRNMMAHMHDSGIRADGETVLTPGISKSLNAWTAKSTTRGVRRVDLSDDAKAAIWNMITGVAASHDPTEFGMSQEVADAINTSDLATPEGQATILATIASLDGTHLHDDLRKKAHVLATRLMKHPEALEVIKKIAKKTGNEAFLSTSAKVGAPKVKKAPVDKSTLNPKDNPEWFMKGLRLEAAMDSTFRPNPRWSPDRPYDTPVGWNRMDSTGVNEGKRIFVSGAKAHSIVEKFKSDIRPALKKYPSMIASAEKDMGTGSKKALAALLTAVIDRTWARIGSDGSNGNQGISLVTRDNMKISSDGTVKFSYTGKQSVKQSHEINLNLRNPTDKRMFDALKELYNSAKTGDHEVFPVGQNEVRDYLLTHGMPKGFTCHSIRSYHATKTLMDAAATPEAKRLPKSSKSAAKWLTRTLIDIDTRLGHKDAKTKGKVSPALYSYVDPQVLQDFIVAKDLAIVTPKGRLVFKIANNPNFIKESVDTPVTAAAIAAIWKWLGIDLDDADEDEDANQTV